MLDFKRAKKFNNQLLAVEKLLDSETSNKQKIKAASKIIKGINPKLDKRIADLYKLEAKIKKIRKGKVGSMMVENLPEKTEKQKKYKKLIVLFLSRRKKLKAEIKRVKKELNTDYPKLKNQTAQELTKLGKILRFAKGPLGVVTIAAAGIVVLQQVAATVVIENHGCDTIEPSVYNKINLPGLKLPSESIMNGGKATATIPPLKFDLSVSQERMVNVKALGINLDFTLEDEGIDILFNGQSLLTGKASIKLEPKSKNALVVSCK